MEVSDRRRFKWISADGRTVTLHERADTYCGARSTCAQTGQELYFIEDKQMIREARVRIRSFLGGNPKEQYFLSGYRKVRGARDNPWLACLFRCDERRHYEGCLVGVLDLKDESDRVLKWTCGKKALFACVESSSWTVPTPASVEQCTVEGGLLAQHKEDHSYRDILVNFLNAYIENHQAQVFRELGQEPPQLESEANDGGGFPHQNTGELSGYVATGSFVLVLFVSLFLVFFLLMCCLTLYCESQIVQTNIKDGSKNQVDDSHLVHKEMDHDSTLVEDAPSLRRRRTHS